MMKLLLNLVSLSVIISLIEANSIVREKRSSDVVPYNIFPGTKWCGNGNIAQNENDLGVEMEADGCCRTHDRCPQNIHGYSTKYNYKNPSAYTLSHCDCDEEFRSCLRQAGTQAANDVASFFFNVLKQRCFLIDEKYSCIKWAFGNWWCQKYGWTDMAIPYDPQPWN